MIQNYYNFNLITNGAILALSGIVLIIYSQFKLNQTQNEYNKIKDAMNANTNQKLCATTKPVHFCNSVAPATWKNNLDIAKMFYTKNESQGTAKPGKKTGGKWNINSGPSKPWGPAPVYTYSGLNQWENTIAIIESANNLGNALGTLTARKEKLKTLFLGGIIFIVFSFLLAIVGTITIGTKDVKKTKKY